MKQIAELVDQLRARANTLERYSAPAAEAFREAADLLRERIAAVGAELLTPEEIEAEGTWCAETVRRAVRRGDVRNAGPGSRIKVQRSDLEKLPPPRAKRAQGSTGGSASAPGNIARRVAVAPLERRRP